MKAMCVRQSNLNITLCRSYEVLDQDNNVGKVKIFDDAGHVIWVDVDCFRF